MKLIKLEAVVLALAEFVVLVLAVRYWLPFK